jgi:hypothetical protein
MKNDRTQSCGKWREVGPFIRGFETHGKNYLESIVGVVEKAMNGKVMEWLKERKWTERTERGERRPLRGDG